MKIPEKIYLYPYSTDGIYEVETKSLEGTVEYCCADAFIEKACDAYCRLCDTKECGGIGECFWVKKFRNYMKGK